MSAPFEFSGREIAGMMRKHRATIRGVAAGMGVTMKRVRQVRREGVAGHSACDFFEGITGSLSPAMQGFYRRMAEGGGQ